MSNRIHKILEDLDKKQKCMQIYLRLHFLFSLAAAKLTIIIMAILMHYIKIKSLSEKEKKEYIVHIT